MIMARARIPCLRNSMIAMPIPIQNSIKPISRFNKIIPHNLPLTAIILFYAWNMIRFKL